MTPYFILTPIYRKKISGKNFIFMNMKYIITESQLKLLIEKKFVNQDDVDAILDKINRSGYESLDDMEKHILKNPDSPIEHADPEDSNCVYELVKLLLSHNLINKKKINVDDKFVEVYEFNDAPDIEWFNGENFIRMYCMIDDGNKVFMDFEDYGDEDRDEVYHHLKEIWEPQLPDTEFVLD
jgi:hypothetical protein